MTYPILLLVFLVTDIRHPAVFGTLQRQFSAFCSYLKSFPGNHGLPKGAFVARQQSETCPLAILAPANLDQDLAPSGFRLKFI